MKGRRDGTIKGTRRDRGEKKGRAQGRGGGPEQRAACVTRAWGGTA